MTGKLSQEEVSKTVDFCFHAFVPVPLAEKEAVLEKMEQLGISDPNVSDDKFNQGVAELQGLLSPEQMRIMHTIRARQMLRSEDTLNIDNFGTDVINGLSPNLVRGDLGLVEARKIAQAAQSDVLALMSGEEKAAASKDKVDGPANDDTNGDSIDTANGHSDGHSEDHVNGANAVHTHLDPLAGTTDGLGDEATRIRLQDTLHGVAEDMESPHDTMLRMFNSVSSSLSVPFLCTHVNQANDFHSHSKLPW